MEINAKLLHILRHSVGLDNNGRGKMYRNHFATGPGGKDFEYCQQLTQLGLMKDLGPQELWGDMHCFIVTQTGYRFLQKAGKNGEAQ